MRIYRNLLEAVREVERDLFEMGIDVQVQTMQDKQVAHDPNYMTKEVRSYGFQIASYKPEKSMERRVLEYVMTPRDQKPDEGHIFTLTRYIDYEFIDRIAGVATNPGKSYTYRKEVWNEFLHNGRFSYTYSERITPQLERIVDELRIHPDSRQGIINIHSNIQPSVEYPIPEGTHTHEELEAFQHNHPGLARNQVSGSADLHNTGGTGRIPCSMYYQVMVRENKVDLIYTMRSCDFLTHFPVDLILAMRMQAYLANRLEKGIGMFTYFTGSLHAYRKDLSKRGIF